MIPLFVRYVNIFINIINFNINIINIEINYINVSRGQGFCHLINEIEKQRLHFLNNILKAEGTTPPLHVISFINQDSYNPLYLNDKLYIGLD